MAELHARLARDCLVVGRFSLCQLLLMRDANYPWFILVPDRDNISEIFQLSTSDQAQLMRESSYLGEKLVQCLSADKLNIAALGNVVPQLHIHHIVRYKTDPAWPDPVWGRFPQKPYTQQEIDSILRNLNESFTDDFKFSAG